MRVKASLGVSPLRTTRSTPSACTERITASVAAMTGGESMTMNLYLVRNSAMASVSLCEDNRSAGFGGRGPVGIAARLGIAGCGTVTRSSEETPARYELNPAYFPVPRFNKRPMPGLRRSVWTLGYHRDVFNPDRSAVLCLDNGLLDIGDGLDQPHGSHIDLLRPLLDEASSGVGIAVGQLLLHLRQGHTVGDQLVGIDANLVLPRRAAEGRIVHHIRHRPDVLADHPVLQRLQLHDVVRRIGALERVPIDRANRTEIGTHAGGNARRKRDLRKPLQYLLAVPVVVGVVIEDQVDDRQAGQRRRAKMRQMRNSIHLDFDRVW